MNAYEICQEMERRMAKMGVHTTAHYDAGTELIAEAIRQAVIEERMRCAAKLVQAGRRWPDNPLVATILGSMANELQEADA